jgi:hypothetical protein
MRVIDMKRVREALPNRTKVELKRYVSSDNQTGLYINIFIKEPSLSDSDFEMVKDWLRDIVGKENILEFFTEETGRDFRVYLKRQPLEISNLSDDDCNNIAGHEIVKEGSLINR